MTSEDLSGPELPRRPVPSAPAVVVPDVVVPGAAVPDPELSASSDRPATPTAASSVDADEPQPPVTGDEDVDALIAQLVAHAAVPLEEQLPILEAVHRTLQDRLADVEG